MSYFRISEMQFLISNYLFKLTSLIKNFLFPFALFAIGIANVQYCPKSQNICAVFFKKS